MRAVIESCPDCDGPVIVTVFRGRDMLVDPDPHPSGDLELLGTRVLPKPIADHRPGQHGLFRPHLASCAVYQSRRTPA